MRKIQVRNYILYDTDLQPSTLQVQLETLSHHFSGTNNKVNLQDILTFLKQFSESERQFFSEIEIIFKLILVNPATKKNQDVFANHNDPKEAKFSYDSSCS